MLRMFFERTKSSCKSTADVPRTQESQPPPPPPSHRACPTPPRPFMRKINTRSVVRATRSTPREINRQIALNLVREHQPMSRADLARRMEIGRGMVTSLIDELLAEGAIY